MPISRKTPKVTRSSSEALAATNPDNLPEVPIPELQRWWFDVRKNLLQDLYGTEDNTTLNDLLRRVEELEAKIETLG